MADRTKILPPTLREKKRYLAFEIISEEKVEFGDILNAFWHSLLNLVGEVGASHANIWFISDSWDENNQRGLIRCDNKYVEYVRAALALIERIGDNRVIPYTLGVSGTMKAARRKFFGERTLEDFETSDEEKVLIPETKSNDFETSDEVVEKSE